MKQHYEQTLICCNICHFVLNNPFLPQRKNIIRADSLFIPSKKERTGGLISSFFNQN